MFISTKKLYATVIFAAFLIVGTVILLYPTGSNEQIVVDSDKVQALSDHQPSTDDFGTTETDEDNSPVAEDNMVENVPSQSALPDEQKSVESTAVNNNKLSWYYMPNKEHRLPEVNSMGKALLSEYDGIYHGDINNKVIYLTFDEGYENGYTPRILDVLKETEVKAAFFITGDYLKKNEELVKRMLAEGHIVGNHTQNHPSLPDSSDSALKSEISTLADSYNNITGGQMKYLRPPMGEYSARSLKITREMGYINVFWSVAMADWVPDAGTPEQNKKTVMDRLHDGAIILLHAVNQPNATMLPDLINECKQQGYRFGTLDEIK
ncbi:delta-lactam-biosynthetic de-N-acetylase [Desulforamulus aquiferis]|uniref:Delta-lactam-biosynthetic de-N-acetylase n=1 Tax=Desulforamulus aquiferis TaxID=1397668 RepID=A0AAW7ZD23_9FIRM|nr:delta-lactam-biosynthetic de-N-acetylase [Desulforamulus aquiferis]MDO7787049.1 delta-lactam-biosynthetic de-N-acetylase [Desulforamulus aquiferis]RYD06558.1 hypothetical protein N752_02510 [Desulforamulus aquiferis]